MLDHIIMLVAYKNNVGLGLNMHCGLEKLLMGVVWGGDGEMRFVRRSYTKKRNEGEE